ncbi:hypothetical protein K7W03_10685 [Sphingobium sp. PNB]|uniref:hypothetical protein n=1 Tax=Sphingobium sp. PNB TaxID=863934 RepID=UPI001CA3E0F3|nr:hypothetical protein [Sphingobium sp. PNB]MCB4860060.1 hypothetical protein [Sphingobium sp. PNB]
MLATHPAVDDASPVTHDGDIDAEALANARYLALSSTPSSPAMIALVDTLYLEVHALACGKNQSSKLRQAVGGDLTP